MCDYGRFSLRPDDAGTDHDLTKCNATGPRTPHRGTAGAARGGTAYRGRNVVERLFNTVRQWRGLATRHDKLTTVYRGAAILWATLTWLT